MSSRSPVPVFVMLVVATACAAVISLAGGEAAAAPGGSPSPSPAPSPVKVTAALSAKTVRYGEQASAAGTVSYDPGTGYRPLAGQRVRVIANGSQVATATTGDDGQFTVALPREPASLTWTVRAGGGPSLGTAAARLPMTVQLPTVISAFHASLNQYWQAGFHGCVSLAAGVPGALRSLAGLVIQYAPGRNGPWRTLGAVPRQPVAHCGNGGLAFAATRYARLNYAFYRAVFPGGTDKAGTGYLPAASGTVLAWKYADRITGFTVSARAVPAGGTFTVSGRLRYFASGWRNFGHRQVQVILRPQGSKNWYWIVRVKTNSRGYFRVRVTDPVSATWAVEYLGDKAHLAAVSAMIFIRASG